LLLPPKICPECGEEYLHSTSTCVHCDVPLVLDGEQPEGREGEELPPISELVCVRAASMGWATGLSEKLAEAGIPHRIQAASDDDDDGGQRRPGHNLPFGIFVLPKHSAAATEIDVEYTGSQIPDIPENFDSGGETGDACPACGDSILESEIRRTAEPAGPFTGLRPPRRQFDGFARDALSAFARSVGLGPGGGVHWCGDLPVSTARSLPVYPWLGRSGMDSPTGRDARTTSASTQLLFAQLPHLEV